MKMEKNLSNNERKIEIQQKIFFEDIVSIVYKNDKLLY